MLSRLYIKHGGYAKASSCAPATLKLHNATATNKHLLSKMPGDYILSMKMRISGDLSVFVYSELLHGGALRQSNPPRGAVSAA